MKSVVIQLIEQSLAGAEISLESASAVELGLDDAFPTDDFIQETVEMLAMYRSGGGDFLFDEAAIRQRLIETLNYLKHS